MDKFFNMILNMSINGAFVVAAVCLARLSIKKAPKIISYSLWAVAGIRFAFPFSIESAYSLNPFRAQAIPPDIALQPALGIGSRVPLLSNAVNNTISDAAGNALPSPATYVDTIANPLRGWMAIVSWVWLAGTAVMIVFGIVCYIRMKRKMGSAIRVGANLYETDGIQSPFVLGVLKPKIYIPLGLLEREREYIILHERTHMRRYDHIIKSAAYFIVCLHWFNPLAWAAFRLMSLDMEMSCDERVLKELGGELNKDYSMSLLSLSTGRHIISGSALAFGEHGVKARIKNVLKFKKSSRIAVVLAVSFVVVLSLALMVSRAGTGDLYEAQAVDAETMSVEPDNVYNSVNNNTYHINTADGADDEKTYVITDYYNSGDGKFSALGLALAERDSEKALTVNGGDVIIAGRRRYEVTAESLTLPFYTQPSIEQVVQWWTDCLDSWAQSGKVATMD